MSSELYYNYAGGNNKYGQGMLGNKAGRLGELLEFYNARSSVHRVSFLAFINDFSQNFSSDWNQQEALGRMDDIATFKKTTRTITVAWDIPAQDMQTAKENLNRCNSLIAMLYPDYTDKGTKEKGSYIMSKPPLVRVKYANLIAKGAGATEGLLGYITSLSWTPILEMGSFHGGTPSNPAIFPRVISLSVEFNVLHEETGADGRGPTGFYKQGGKNVTLRETSRYQNNSSGLYDGGWPFGGIPKKNERKGFDDPEG